MKKDLRIFASNIEEDAKRQIDLLLEQEAFKTSKIRVMPDVHSGKGCVVGFTGDLGNKVIPNIVGVDIGCGVLCVSLGDVDIDFEELDGIIREYIPSGMNVHKEAIACIDVYIDMLRCGGRLHNIENWLKKSLGSLGGGNHFIEIDEDEIGNKYLVIHTGSRNLGKQVCEIYQQLAIEHCSYKKEKTQEKEKIIRAFKEQKKEDLIQKSLEELDKKYEGKTKLPKDLCFLEGQERANYLYDMDVCQSFARYNRELIALTILQKLNLKEVWHFESVHNYIDFRDNIVRKGAISAKKGELVIIPLNMKDGCILGVGKGNKEWNYSAPHGAGRIMSRNNAKENLNLEDYKKNMEGIYSTSVCEGTLDEAPMAYKPIEDIMAYLEDTVEIRKIIKPIYNFKAKE